VTVKEYRRNADGPEAGETSSPLAPG